MKVAAFLTCLLVLAISFTIVTGNGLVGFVTAAALLTIVPLAWARGTGRSRTHSGSEDWWHGYVSFQESYLLNHDVFPGIVARKDVGGLLRKGLSSGKLRITPDGIRWRSGGWATPQTRIKGEFYLPWSKVGAFKVWKMGGKIPGLGGGIEVNVLGVDHPLTGEFLGSVKGISEAFARVGRSQADV